jgi:mono/diheme cytochrome c family protein
MLRAPARSISFFERVRKGGMKSRIYFGASLFVLGLLAFKFNSAAEAEPAKDAAVKRGQYLVERVAMCADCHTPRTDKGDYDMTAWLQGNVLDFKPSHPMPFAMVAPQIAGLPTYPTDELAVRFFETGTNAAGKTAMPPMPQFRFEHDDAMAVVAYLRSLKK